MSAIGFYLVLPVFYYLMGLLKKIRHTYLRTELLACAVGSAARVALKQTWSQGRSSG